MSSAPAASASAVTSARLIRRPGRALALMQYCCRRRSSGHRRCVREVSARDGSAPGAGDAHAVAQLDVLAGVEEARPAGAGVELVPRRPAWRRRRRSGTGVGCTSTPLKGAQVARLGSGTARASAVETTSTRSSPRRPASSIAASGQGENGDGAYLIAGLGDLGGHPNLPRPTTGPSTGDRCNLFEGREPPPPNLDSPQARADERLRRRGTVLTTPGARSGGAGP